MDVLVLGGTAWLGREVTRQAVDRGHAVTCLARGESGPVANGAVLVAADRRQDAAYDQVRDRRWDAVIEVALQPGLVRGALTALGERAAHWTYVSSGEAPMRRTRPSAPTSPSRCSTRMTATRCTAEQYGQAKVACEQASAAAVGGRLLIARAGLIGGPGDHTDDPATGLRGPHATRGARCSSPAVPDMPTQVIDVRDLAAWFLDSRAGPDHGNIRRGWPRHLVRGAGSSRPGALGGHPGPCHRGGPGLAARPGRRPVHGPGIAADVGGGARLGGLFRGRSGQAALDRRAAAPAAGRTAGRRAGVGT